MGSVDALVERADAGAAIPRFSRIVETPVVGENTRHQLPAAAKVPPARIKDVCLAAPRGGQTAASVDSVSRSPEAPE